MNIQDKIKTSPIASIVLVGVVFFYLIFFSSSKGVQYGDFGLMYIQVKDIVESGYSTFAVRYKGEKADPDHKYFPYTKPFIGKVGQKYYIDFPPYFPLLNTPFYQYFGMNGIYILSYLALLGTLYLIYKIGVLYELSFEMIHLSIFLYSFGMTATMYNLVFHEYPIAIFLITSSFYFGALYYTRKNNYSLVWFGLLGGLSLFFRLEMIFVILSIGISLVLTNPKDFFKIGFLSFLGFIFPFIALLSLNQYIHGHPLGLRYILTLTEDSSISLLGRIDIIRDMLFSSTRGFFFQSSFVIILPFILFLRKLILFQERFLFLLLFFGFGFILLTAPNHGDHRAPRYLFGLYPILVLLVVISFSSYIKATSFEGKSVFQKPIQILFSILVLISFLATIQNYRWMQKATVNVISLNETISNLADSETAIIFRDYAQPLNTQKIYLERTVFVSEKLENLSELIHKIRESGFKKILVSQVYSAPLNEEAKEKIFRDYITSLSLSKISESSYEIGNETEKGFVSPRWIQFGKNQNLFILNLSFLK
ncbi:MAG TPA: hypothetical protein PLP33_18605 [Leptospiraceae bacterium]|nr:hypothetical protein [Leptospiraceae bacterium]HNF54520.1 hypothetical protein [Leptospiraceae bacterium]